MIWNRVWSCSCLTVSIYPIYVEGFYRPWVESPPRLDQGCQWFLLRRFMYCNSTIQLCFPYLHKDFIMWPTSFLCHIFAGIVKMYHCVNSTYETHSDPFQKAFKLLQAAFHVFRLCYILWEDATWQVGPINILIRPFKHYQGQCTMDEWQVIVQVTPTKVVMNSLISWCHLWFPGSHISNVRSRVYR